MKTTKVIVLMIFAILLTSCQDKYPSDYPASPGYSLEDIMYPTPGNSRLECDVAIVDYSNASQGYIIGYLKEGITQKVKIQISKDDIKYNYDLSSIRGISYPLQMGSGNYTIKILVNIEGTKYAILQTLDLSINISDELLPFLYPNLLVNYYPDDQITFLAIEVAQDEDDDLSRITTIYEYVVNYLTYDKQKAKQATLMYLIPDLTELIKVKKGICFDYASMMVAMLRINHLPARLICGATDDDEYHAWVEVYLTGAGWVNPDIFIDQNTWTIMDPTFASNKYDYDGQYVETLYY